MPSSSKGTGSPGSEEAAQEGDSRKKRNKNDDQLPSVGGQATAASSFTSPSQESWPFPRWKDSLVEAAVETFRILEASEQEEWDNECAKYEEFEEVVVPRRGSVPLEPRPRRNYVNSRGTVDDETLYPYHTSLYPLLDAYDPLYSDAADDGWEVTTEEILRRQPIVDPDTAVPPSHLAPSARTYRNHYRNVEGDDDADDDADDDVGNFDGYSPASAEATLLTLLGDDAYYRPPVEANHVSLFFEVFEDVTMALVHKLCSPSFRVEKEWMARKDERDRNAYLHGVAFEPVTVSAARVDVDDDAAAAHVGHAVTIETWRQGRSMTPAEHMNAEELSNPDRRTYGIEHLPADPRLRTTVLLKLLRHSLSELQRDHRLAAAASFNLMLFRDFEDVSVLSKFLAICDLEYGARLDLVYNAMEQDDDGVMTRPVNPIRYEVYMFGRIISWLLAVGMVSVTRPHAVALAGFCRGVFEREMGHLHTERHLHHKPRKGQGRSDEQLTPTSFEERQRWSAKRYAFLRNAEEDRDAAFTSSKKVPLFLVQEVIRGLCIRAMMEKHRLLEWLGKDPNAGSHVEEDVLAQSLEGFHNCLFSLVDIGEAVIKYLPTSERFYSLASELVRSFAYLLADTSTLLTEATQAWYMEGQVNQMPDYIGRADPNLKHASIAASRRFADSISRATEREAALREPRVARGRDATTLPTSIRSKIELAFYGKPPLCVQEVVRGLFVRDLVDVLWAGCGYNDFCLWCRFDITPLDPAMYWHDTSYPGENYRADDDDEENEDDDNERNDDEIMINWEFDEEGNEMNLGCVGASLDYSLMLLLREWYRPWSPESHASFSPEFRSAIKSVLLASHRLHLPTEVVHKVLEFLPRNCWPDARRQCWNFDCQVDSTQHWFNANRADRPSIPERFLTSNEYIRCPHCRIATYCSDACRTSDWKNFHKPYCNRPPCRIPGPDEEAFIASLEEQGESLDSARAIDSRDDARLQPASVDEASANVVEDDGDEDWEDEESDDEDWEDVESDDEDGSNGGDVPRAQRIYRFFRDRAYRYQE